MFKVKKIAHAIALAGVSGSLMQAAWADDVTAMEGTPHKVEKISVTGSNIKRSNTETASPVQVITRKEIEDSGATTVMQVLALTTSISSDLNDLTTSNSFAEGGSGVEMRGLGKQATLLLLNGRRMPSFGLTDGGQTAFSNVDALPMDAIERVEVLKDGASAVYGSDAMAGVINIITRKDYTGLQLNVSDQISSRIHKAGEQDGAVTFGFGDLEKDRFNIFGTVSTYHRNVVQESNILGILDPKLYQHTPSTGTWSTFSNPGNYEIVDTTGAITGQVGALTGQIKPVGGCAPSQIVNGLCEFDRWKYVNVTPKTTRDNGYVSAHYELGNDIEGFTELSVSHINYWSPQAVPTLQSGGAPWTYVNTTIPGAQLNYFPIPYLSATNPYNTTGQVVGLRYRFDDNPGMFGDGTVDNEYRFVTGLKGNFSGWDWETAVTSSRSRVDQADTGRAQSFSVSGFKALFGPITTDPVTGLPLMNDHPGYNFHGQNSQSVLSELFPTLRNIGESKETSFDAKATKTIATLPGGDLGMAVGVQLRHDTLNETYDQRAATGDIFNDGVAINISGAQTISAIYTEFDAPITKKLEADFALRADKYPNFAAAVTPKLGIKYNATEDLLLRGTYAEGFRAPNIAESGKGSIAAYNQVQDPLRCAAASAMQAVLNQSSNPADQTYSTDLSDCNVSAPGGSQSNPNLKPEKSKSITIGAVFSPNKLFDISVDYFLIERRNEIAPQQAQLIANTPSLYPGQLQRGPITANDLHIEQEVATLCANAAANGITGCPSTNPTFTVGSISQLTTLYQNFGRTLTDGFDIDAHSHIGLGAYGKLMLGLSTTITDRLNAYQQGIYNGGNGWGVNQRGHYAVPGIRSVFSSDWDYGPYHSGLRVNYTGPQALWNDVTDTNWNQAGCLAQNYTQSICQEGVGSWTTADLAFAYTGIKSLTINLNVLNVFDRKPWFDPENSVDLGVNQFENPNGRVYKLGVGYKFW